MRSRQSLPFYLVVCLSTAASAFSAISWWIATSTAGRLSSRVGFFIPLAGGMLALLAAARASGLRGLVAALAGRALCLLWSVAYTQGLDAVAHVLLCSVLAELCLFVPYPANAVGAVATTTAAVCVRVVAMASRGPWEIALAQVPLATTGYVVAAFGSLLTRYREGMIDLEREKGSLESLAVHLTRASTQYLDYAMLARESGQSEERMRITRDIHDIVGYTLTNNMMLMETAMDMMQENPLGVPSVIQLARANAQEGLGRIRQALYALRKEEATYPVGLRAIQRLVRIFREATNVDVRCDLANLPLSLPEDIDSALYHLVQEGLMNSFRHGKASRITIVFWRGHDGISAAVRDNGIGAEEISEGLGIRGMRERIEGIGGTLSARGAGDGFLLRAWIPHRGAGGR